MWTHRSSIDAVAGYSSLSIMFLSMLMSIKLVNLVIEPRLTERGEVLPRIAVEHQLVIDDLKGRLGRDARERNPVLGHGNSQRSRGEHIAVGSVACAVSYDEAA